MDFRRVQPGGMYGGHFTQVVWKGSKEVGLGQAKAKDGKIFVVASYRPAGNMMGQFKDNVFKPDGPIVLPKKEEPKPMTFRSFGGADGSPGDSGMTRIVHTKTMPTTTSTQRTVRTVTNQGGPQTVSRMVVTETKTGPNGETITTTKETINGKETTTTKVTRKGESERLKNLHLDEDVTGNKYLPTNAWESSNNHVPAKPKPCKQSSNEFIDDCVRAHNHLRARHGAPPLKHNPDLSAHAQKWAEHLAELNVMKHSKSTFKGVKPGENVATRWSSDGGAYTGKDAVAQWYSEISKYDFKTASRCLTAGHFTQVVWKGSKEIGVGRAVGQDGRVYVVANYLPPGNMLGAFKENVLPPNSVPSNVVSFG
ncbi:protein PRY2 isoform X2 [Lingula anatina]|uniref:Protein PRY2 isoform X2 n=1 Tax=Lingula anatina TaxID=7574 RepID=A0A1S3I1C4_LINAN|nr:protein PRY2 isoform X2 [Lingula anatina]|eukprot:XP_013391631.1 protein PRY2 isoform X2 [Lingula anatina]